MLCKAHYSQAFRTVYGMVGNEADAQDVTQQAWLKAWQKIHNFNFQSVFST
ncbi:MAG: RNA polymerase sigma factor [Lentimonas sp.]